MPPVSSSASRETKEAELQKREKWGNEDAPYVPQRRLLYVLLAGSIMSFIGTPIMYVVYAATEYELYSPRRGPLPVVTDMFGDWPLLSHAVTGIGLTLLFSGLIATSIARIPLDVKFTPRTTIVEFSVVGQLSLWLLLPTSHRFPAGTEVGSWIHYASTFALMGSSIYVLYQAAVVCLFFAYVLVDPKIMWYSWAGTACVWLAVVGIVGATVTGGLTAVMGRQDAPQYLWPLMAVFELVVLGFGGIGYFLVIYAYDQIEKRAAE